MNVELGNKNNMIVSLSHQLSKQTECITSLNHNKRFSNNVIDNNGSNNDNISHRNNFYADKNCNNNNNNNSNNNNNNNCNSTISNQSNESNSNSNHHNHISSNNSNSRVKHKNKKPKDNFNWNNDNDNNNFNNGGNNCDNPLDNENQVKYVNNTRNTVFILGDIIVKDLNGYL